MIEDRAEFDPSREPFAQDGIDPDLLARNVDVDTGEVDPPGPRSMRGPARDPRVFPTGDARTTPWPPRSRGPLPQVCAPEFDIVTAQDEIDAWAWEHDDATNRVAEARLELNGSGDKDGVEIEVMRARAKHRRKARQNPLERGRRTGGDIDAEVDEALADDRAYQRKLELETAIEIALGRLFRAKDNIHRLDRYIGSLPRPYQGEGGAHRG